jgi:DNA-binding transcriptional MerR regulator
MLRPMPIGEVAHQTGIKVPTIRYYEQIGLLPALPRSEGNRRCYGEKELKRLAFIRQARALGFDIEAIRKLLALQDQPDMACGQIDALVAEHLTAVNDRIEKLIALRFELQRMLASCTGGRVSECRVIESIATCDCRSSSDPAPNN